MLTVVMNARIGIIWLCALTHLGVVEQFRHIPRISGKTVPEIDLQHGGYIHYGAPQA